MTKINLKKSGAEIAPPRREPPNIHDADERIDAAEVNRRQVAYLSRLGLPLHRAQLVAAFAFGGGAL